MTDTDLEIIKRLNELQRRVANLERREGQRPILDNYLNTFALKALWNFGAVDVNWNARDLSGNGLTLTATTPSLGITARLFPYAAFPGASYYARASEPALVLGSPGTIGGWFWVDAILAGAQGLMGKWVSAGNQRSYLLYVDASGNGGNPVFAVSSNGTAFTIIGAGAGVPAMPTAQWVFLAASYYPSSYMTIYLNTVKYTNVTSIPASCFGSTAPFEIGRHDAGTYLTGRASLCFMTNYVLNDNQVRKLYNCSKWAFTS